MAGRVALAVVNGQPATVGPSDFIVGDLSYAVPQSLTTAQQVQGLQNLGVGPRWSQFYAAVEAARAGDMRNVSNAVAADPSDPANIEFTHGSFVVVGGALWTLIQSTLGYTAAQMAAVLVSAAGYPATGAAATATAIAPAATSDAQAGTRSDVWMSPAATAAEVAAILGAGSATLRPTIAAYAAAGTTQATATAITTNIGVVTSGASGSGVILSGIPQQEVLAAGSSPTLVYPLSGAAIWLNGSLGSVNSPITLQVGNHGTWLTVTSSSTTPNTIQYQGP